MKRAIAKEWLWLLSMLIVGAIAAPLCLYGFSTYHYNFYQVEPKAVLGFVRKTAPKDQPVPYDTTSGLYSSDEKLFKYNMQALYDALTARYDIGTFDVFMSKMKSPKSQQRISEVLGEPYFSDIVIQQAFRVDESGYKIFFANICQSSHYLLLLAPYLICIFCRFTYWSVRTALVRRATPDAH